jgi:hypothetical protein
VFLATTGFPLVSIPQSQPPRRGPVPFLLYPVSSTPAPLALPLISPRHHSPTLSSSQTDPGSPTTSKRNSKLHNLVCPVLPEASELVLELVQFFASFARFIPVL